MGQNYSLGVISEFEAESNQKLTMEMWKEKLNQRIDMSLFDLTVTENKLTAVLKPDIFRENIKGLYSLLKDILGENRNGNLDYYEEEFGEELDNYQIFDTYMVIKDKEGCKIHLNVSFALLLVEGKVFAEEFYTDPILVNWLFRNCHLDNKLTGCMVSDIVG